MKEIEVLVNHNNIEFSYSNSSKITEANIDEDRITEVIYNLVENAIKYNDKENGKISISVIDKYNSIQVSVYDNGKGISCSDLPHIFTKFYRAEKSRSMRIPGSGLGLSISKYIVQKHNGEISANSKLGEYTEISFTIGTKR